MADVNPLHCSAPRDARRRPVSLFSLLHIAALAVLGGMLATVLCSCKSSQAQAVAAEATKITAPSADVSATIRTRVAAAVKAAVLAHPKTAPWANGFANVCFEFCKIRLPSPTALRGLFAVAEVFAPDDIDQVLDGILRIYGDDYTAALTVQGAGGNYLLLLGQGIQDGIASARAASTGEAP